MWHISFWSESQGYDSAIRYFFPFFFFSCHYYGANRFVLLSLLLHLLHFLASTVASTFYIKLQSLLSLCTWYLPGMVFQSKCVLLIVSFIFILGTESEPVTSLPPKGGINPSIRRPQFLWLVHVHTYLYKSYMAYDMRYWLYSARQNVRKWQIGKLRKANFFQVSEKLGTKTRVLSQLPVQLYNLYNHFLKQATLALGWKR